MNVTMIIQGRNRENVSLPEGSKITDLVNAGELSLETESGDFLAATVDGSYVPLTHVLNDGDVVYFATKNKGGVN